jgi:site-specific DNA-methyltransferase (adenine-specific)
MDFRLFNRDCIKGCRDQIEDRSVDLLICDPPFGLGDHESAYNRDGRKVLDGYKEAPRDYSRWSYDWLREAKRVLVDDGSIYVVSGWSNLRSILDALHDLDMPVVNHLIWKYNFGVYTTRKFVSSHYHILYAKRSTWGKPYFDTHCRYLGGRDKDGSRLYRDLEDVWVIPRENHPGRMKNKNKLPDALVRKMVQYSSRTDDVVCDLFLGNFTTAYVASDLGRRVWGFEVNQEAFRHHCARLIGTEQTDDWMEIDAVWNLRRSSGVEHVPGIQTKAPG